MSDDHEWMLDADQMIFMMNHHNLIMQAYDTGDLSLLEDVIGSDAYKEAFDDMTWDEAYDRYETFLEKSNPEPPAIPLTPALAKALLLARHTADHEHTLYNLGDLLLKQAAAIPDDDLRTWAESEGDDE